MRAFLMDGRTSNPRVLCGRNERWTGVRHRERVAVLCDQRAKLHSPDKQIGRNKKCSAVSDLFISAGNHGMSYPHRNA